MDKMPDCLKGSFKAYFLGIGGVSMSALATYLAQKGVCVSGCDKMQGEFVSRLLNDGVAVDIFNSDGGYGGVKIPKGLIEADLVVYTSALPQSDELLQFCEKNGKLTLSRAQLLREISASYPFSIGVGGTHGKTTCTCMLAHIFKQANKKFCAHIGGQDKFLGNIYHSGNDYFITEVCEYKRNISLFAPSIGIILNVDNDHLDSYGDFSSVCAEFLNYAKRSGVCVYNADDKALCGAKLKIAVGVSFSLKNPACDYYATDARFRGKYISFKVFERGKFVGIFKIKSMFIHNVYNALASISAARLCGISFNNIKHGLFAFSGVARREEWLFEYNGALVFADYCHHPAQIKQTVFALRRLKSKRLTVVFQPHTYSRTKSLFEEFICALSTLRGGRGCENCNGVEKKVCLGEDLQKCAKKQKNMVVRLIITDTYAAREDYDYFGSGKRLAGEIAACEYIGDKRLAVRAALSGARVGDVIAFLGAGDIYSEVKKMQKNPPIG